MNNLPEDRDASPGEQQRVNIPFDFTAPGTQSGFLMSDHQWNQLREQVSRIRPSESLWFSACLAFLTVGVSFLISVTQLGLVETWITTAFWAASASGFIGAVLCGVGYWADKRRRIDDIQAVLNYMDEIRRMP